jgi:adenosylmethionine-8-amino-7-oxononanoate aminotransferase
MSKIKITAYDMKAKEKGVEMLDAVIDRNGNRCFAKGVSAAGNKMCVAIGLENAKAAIKAGVAKKGKGW